MDRDFWGSGWEALKGVFRVAKGSVLAAWKRLYHRPLEQYVQKMHSVKQHASRFAALVLLEEDEAGSADFATRLICPSFFSEAFLYMVDYPRSRTGDRTTRFRTRLETSWPMFQEATAYTRRQFHHAPNQVTDGRVVA